MTTRTLSVKNEKARQTGPFAGNQFSESAVSIEQAFV